MAKLSRGTRLVVASHNPGKVWEINQLIEKNPSRPFTTTRG